MASSSFTHPVLTCEVVFAEDSSGPASPRRSYMTWWRHDERGERYLAPCAEGLLSKPRRLENNTAVQVPVASDTVSIQVDRYVLQDREGLHKVSSTILSSRRTNTPAAQDDFWTYQFWQGKLRIMAAADIRSAGRFVITPLSQQTTMQRDLSLTSPDGSGEQGWEESVLPVVKRTHEGFYKTAAETGAALTKAFGQAKPLQWGANTPDSQFVSEVHRESIPHEPDIPIQQSQQQSRSTTTAHHETLSASRYSDFSSRDSDRVSHAHVSDPVVQHEFAPVCSSSHASQAATADQVTGGGTTVIDRRFIESDDQAGEVGETDNGAGSSKRRKRRGGGK